MNKAAVTTPATPTSVAAAQATLTLAAATMATPTSAAAALATPTPAATAPTTTARTPTAVTQARGMPDEDVDEEENDAEEGGPDSEELVELHWPGGQKILETLGVTEEELRQK